MSSPLNSMSEHPGGDCADGGARERPVLPARSADSPQAGFWAPASAAARGRGPDAALPGPGAVPHPPLVRAPWSQPVPATGSGRDAVHGPAPDDCPAPLPGCRAVGMIPAQPSPAPSPPWPGSDGLRRASPELRYGLAGLALAGCQCLLRQPLVPTGPQNHVRIFSNHAVLAGAPLRNRTVDLLLTMDNLSSADQAEHTGKTPSTWRS